MRLTVARFIGLANRAESVSARLHGRYTQEQWAADELKAVKREDVFHLRFPGLSDA